MLCQQGTAAHESSGFILRQGRPGTAGNAVQDSEYLVHIGQHMRFCAAERRHTHPGQPLLQSTKVDLAHRQVVRQVDRARSVCRIHRA